MLNGVLIPLFHVLVFPGFLFLCLAGFLVEYADRKLYARFQNRVGPPLIPPLADFIKLASKQEIVPREADRLIFRAMPLTAAAAVACAFLYVPMWGYDALFSFEGDLVVVLYLLTLPTLAFFLGGVYSTSLFASIGALRVVTQLFAYEVPLFLALLSPALVSGSWSISGIAAFYGNHPWWWCFNLPAIAVGLTTTLGKLEKTPFDIAEAETEIVGGIFTEYSGRHLALFHLAIDMEEVVAASLLAAVFLPFGLDLDPAAGFLVYAVKVFFIVGLLALLRTVMARLRIDQMMQFCWKILAPTALLQIIVSLVVKGALQ
jgi:NADH-quinone oxidoreductase subunit H